MLWSLVGRVAFGQSGGETLPQVANVRVETTLEQVIIRYDAADLLPRDSVFVRVEGRTRGLLAVKTLAGDAGTDLTAGLNKVIVWDYVRDGETLDDEIQAIISVKRLAAGKPAILKGPATSSRRAIGGGPANALLSAVLPGLGNVMVQPNRRVRFQPAIAGVGVGALAYGLMQKGKSNRQYALYWQQPYDRLAQPYYDRANSLHHRHILAVGTAALVWVADITYTLLKGRANDRLRSRNTAVFQPIMNVAGQRPVVGFRYQF